MIRVRSPLEFEADPKGGWRLMFWVEAFDYKTPFRAILADIANVLGLDAQTDLQLPAHEVNEDFIEGTLQFGTVAFGVYYEHSLGYLTLFSEEQAELRDAAERIQRRVTLVAEPIIRAEIDNW